MQFCARIGIATIIEYGVRYYRVYFRCNTAIEKVEEVKRGSVETKKFEALEMKLGFFGFGCALQSA